MLTQAFLGVFVNTVNYIFSFFPAVLTLPKIGSYDIDGALVSGIGQFHTVSNALWPLQIMFEGFLFLMAYYALKILANLIFGHRAPK